MGGKGKGVTGDGRIKWELRGKVGEDKEGNEGK